MQVDPSDFHGVWQLEEWTVTHNPSQRTRQPYGGNVSGHLIYSPQNWVAATLMETDRQPVDQDRPALQQIKLQLREDPGAIAAEALDKVIPYYLAAFGYVSYCGPFRVTADQVHHQVQEALIPQWVGSTLSRGFEFDADRNRLILSALQGEMTDQLVWQRLRT